MPTKTVRWTLSLTVLLLLAAVAYLLWRPSAAERPNVLWITMDSLRAGHLGCNGYHRATSPNIDALAREGALFTQCIAQSNYTNISVPSMVTGIYPYLLDVRTPLHELDDLFITLAERLSEQGYATYAVLPDWPPGTNQGFQRVEILDGKTEPRTRACLDILGDLNERPFFIWLYYWDPHAPYQPPEEFARRFRSPAETSGTTERTDSSPGDVELRQRSQSLRLGWEMMRTMVSINEGRLVPESDYGQRLMALYDGEIAFVDSEIERVVAAIKEMGLWDRTLVVLNADHGESFGEHGLFFHGYGFYEEEIRVPLIIKPPRSLPSPRRVDGPVRNLDILPTILDYCGLASPQNINGRSLRLYIEKPLSPDLATCVESNTPQKNVHLAAYRQGDYKVIYRRGAPTELYHLVSDPDERRNLLAPAASMTPEEISAAERMEAQLRRDLLAVYGVDEVDDLMYTHFRQNIDSRNRERLRALGYVY